MGLKGFIKTFFRRILLAILIAGFAASCGTTNLQSVTVKSLVPNPPVRITENRTDHVVDLHMNIALSPKSTLEGNIGGHSDVNADGIYQVEKVPNEDYYLEHFSDNIFEFDGNNFKWLIPTEQVTLDMDIALPHEIALTAGLNFSNYETKQHLGYSFGFGHFSESLSSAWRLDFMLTYNTRENEILALHKESELFASYEKVQFFSINQSRKYQNWNLAYTYNTKNSDLIDYFFSTSIGFEELFNADSPVSNARLSETVTYYSFTGGVYKNTFGIGRIVLGGRVTMFMMEGRNIFLPNLFLQYDILLF